MRKFYLLMLSIALTSPTLFAQIYVTEAGGATTKDGASWATAYDSNQLQVAINEATAGQQVWVAKGTYKPTESLSITGFLDDGTTAVTAKDQAFILKAGVLIYGGFAGTEVAGFSLADRNFVANKTILSGDFNNDNVASDGDYYHVVANKADISGAVLDGFTIQHGYAVGAGKILVAGGLIESNRGGAIAISGAATAVMFKNLVITNNFSNASGGGVYLRKGTSMLISASVFTNNISDNTSNTSGGGIMNFGDLTVTNSLFKENVAKNGGAIYNYNNLIVSKTKFHANSTSVGSGGAIYVYGINAVDSKTTISNSEFYNNISAGTGGAIFHNRPTVGTYAITVTVINSTFYKNKAIGTNGGGYGFNSYKEASINLYNNIFVDNLISYDTVTQTGNSSDANSDLRSTTTPVQTLSNNLFQTAKSTSGSRTSTNNILLSNPAEPLFSSTNENDANFLYLVAGSFAIDKGKNSLYSEAGDLTTDKNLAGENRLEGTIVDLGAYEYLASLPVSIHSFKASLVNGRSQLTWKVGAETNVNRYDVYRSKAGVKFDKVITIKATQSATYQAVDATPISGTNYYRLVTVDNDGSESIYKEVQVLKVASLSKRKLQVFPNPVTGSTVKVSLIDYPSGDYSYKLVNTLGNAVQQGKLIHRGAAVTLGLSSAMKKGIYVLSVNNGAQEVQTKLVKN